MITVLGASGFIGSHLVTHLRERGIPCYAPGRDADLTDRHLGQVVYCIGVTGDFRTRPLDTIEAHVCGLVDVLKKCRFDSLVYLSSTRVYGTRQSDRAAEPNSLYVNPLDPSDVYNLSKLMGEAAGLHSGKNVHVVRISNVYGEDWDSDNFLPSVIRDAVDARHVRLRSSLDSAKDYVSLRDVIQGLYSITSAATHPVYNLAAGFNVTTRQLMEVISEVTGCGLEVVPEAPTRVFPEIDIHLMREEFDFQPANLLDEIEELIRSYAERGAKRP